MSTSNVETRAGKGRWRSDARPAFTALLPARENRGPTLRVVLFTALVLISTVPVIVLAFWVQQSALRHEIASVTEKHLLIARNLSGALSRYVTDVKEGFRLAVANGVGGSDTIGMERLLRSFSFRHVCIFDERNELVSYLTSRPDGSRRALPPEETINLLREKARAKSGEIIVSDLMRDGGEPVFFVLQALDNGYLAVGVLGTDFVRQVQRAIAFGERGHSMIVDRLGKVVAHPNGHWEATSKDVSEVSVVAKMMNGETGVATFFSPPMQSDMIAGYTVVPEVGWGVMVPQPISELEEKAEGVRSVAIALSLIGVLVAALIGWWLAKILARPIVAVADAASQVAAGKLDTRVGSPARRTPRELRRLFESFNAMVGELKRREEGLQEARTEAEAANCSKTEFLHNMSHELRTPLNAIIGFADAMKQEIFGPVGRPEYRDYLDNIQQSGDHLLAIINDILDLAKIESGNYALHDESIDMAGAVTLCVRLVGERVEQTGPTVHVDVADGVPPLKADDRAVKQILINLLSNAVKFTPAGGQIRVRVSLNTLGGADLSVSDTGIGIAKEDIVTAVAHFGQVDGSLSRRYMGTGLGLPLVAWLAKLHGADMRIDSEVGLGTTVTVSFPCERLRPASPDKTLPGTWPIATAVV